MRFTRGAAPADTDDATGRRTATDTMIELVVIVVAGLVIFDVVYELARMWVRHVEQADALERAAQRRRRRRQRQVDREVRESGEIGWRR